MTSCPQFCNSLSTQYYTLDCTIFRLGRSCPVRESTFQVVSTDFRAEPESLHTLPHFSHNPYPFNTFCFHLDTFSELWLRMDARYCTRMNEKNVSPLSL